MGRRTAFADVLDEKLGAENAPRPAAAPTYAHRATVHTFYEFAAATKPVAGWHPRQPYVTTAAPTGRSANETARTTRRLSAEEGAALEQLNALGARVRPDFTAEELRSAFRGLARTFHPDRHPLSTADEVARLSQRFILLHDAYRALLNTVGAAA